MKNSEKMRDIQNINEDKIKICHYTEKRPKVITIDGPAGSGKSTVAALVARFLGWTYVTTGAIYRTVAWMLKNYGVNEDDQKVVLHIIEMLNKNYKQDPQTGTVFLGDKNITEEIRSPDASERASIVAQNEFVREHLLPLQRKVVLSCKGAVVDGRDMGTVVFPNAPLKFFLTADPEERAKRRYAELQAKGQNVDLDSLLREVHERDARDANRAVAPMCAADDAIILDCTTMNAEKVVAVILDYAAKRGLIEKNNDTVL